jgi:hypothetical protein
MKSKLDRKICHGALLLALDLIGMQFERIDDQKDAFMNTSNYFEK